MSERILIVDDEAANLSLFSDMLVDSYEIDTAASGEEALARVRETPPDLVLLDVMMADISGIEVCKILKTNPATSSIPVIFITGLGDVNDEQNGLAVGAVDYITKPIHPAVLKARVQVHVEHRQYTNYLEALIEQRTRSLDEARRQAQLLLEGKAWSE